VTHNLTTFNKKIMFSEGGFSDKKCTKIVFVFSRGSAPDPAEGTTTQRSPRSRSPLGEGNTSCPFPCPSTHSVSRCPVQFLPRDAMHPRYMLWPCVCVCLSVCPSQVGVLLKRLNIGSHKQHRTIAQGL